MRARQNRADYTILRKEDEIRFKHLILENLKARKQLQLSQPGAATNVVQSHVGQFRQVLEASFPAGQEHEQHCLHQMSVVGPPAHPWPSFSICGQTHQMQPTPPVTWTITPNTPNCTY
ncbi:hypothetical protein CDL15_Pgr021004 [Punica granatum]|uniref:Uncharacterized protein n=1 Tax=Punica granatum TaxID=22663 RepID=A0A218Y1K1_PUNGR|nr:hypothetical protein CDL15_Pgr021004 [Punica granatum]